MLAKYDTATLTDEQYSLTAYKLIKISLRIQCMGLRSASKTAGWILTAKYDAAVPTEA
jgi:hypothetical protein